LIFIEGKFYQMIHTFLFVNLGEEVVC